jgi:hypothetical protein
MRAGSTVKTVNQSASSAAEKRRTERLMDWAIGLSRQGMIDGIAEGIKSFPIGPVIAEQWRRLNGANHG